MEVLFSVNEYDYEGDVSDTGIYLHFGDVRVKIANTIEEFDAFIERLQSMKAEIRDNYLL